jgi:hypothetical protein
MRGLRRRKSSEAGFLENPLECESWTWLEDGISFNRRKRSNPPKL